VLLAPVDVEDLGLGQPRDEPAQVASATGPMPLVRVRVSIRLTPASRARRMTRASLRRLQTSVTSWPARSSSTVARAAQ